MTRIGITRTLALAALTGLAGPADAATFDLAPKFKEGQSVHYLTRGVIRHDVAVEGVDETQQIAVLSESGMSLDVVRVADDGSAELRWRLRYLCLKTDGAIPGIAEMLDYDSRQSGGSSPLAPMFARLIEQPVTVKVDAAGRVIDFEGLPAGGSGGWSSLVDPLSSLADGFFSKETFEQLPLFVTAGAARPARVRATWSHNTSVTLPLGVGSLVMDQAFTFRRVNTRRETAELEMKGTLTKGVAAGGGAASMLGLADAFVVENGAVGGQYVWDIAVGQLASAETQMDLTSSLNTPVGRMLLRQTMTTYIERTTSEKVTGLRTPATSRPAEAPAERQSTAREVTP